MTDKLFPVPEPTFLFIHAISIYQNSGIQTTDERGKWSKKLATAASVPAMGYLTGPNANIETSAGTNRESIAAVCLVSNSTLVKHEDIIECHDPTLPPNLAGAYSVEAVRVNVSHTRVLLKRMDEQWNEF